MWRVAERRSFKSTLSAAVLLTGLSAAVWAHDGATGVVRERMDAMEGINKQLKTIATMFKGERAFDGKALSQSARIIAGHAQRMPALFPKGTNPHPSEALPVIWQDWDRFTALAKDLEVAAGDLAEKAQTAADVAEVSPELRAVGATCKGCHQKYRKAN